MSELIKVAETKDVPAGKAIAVDVQGVKVAIFNIDGSYYAVDDTCTHKGGPLSEGELEGTVVTCPWHGATFDLTTGNHLGPPAPTGVTRREVKIEGDDVMVRV